MDIMDFRENVIWFYDINDINNDSSEFKKKSWEDGPELCQKVRKFVKFSSVLFFFVLLNVEVFEFVGLFVSGHHMEVVSQLLLLQVFLGQVFEVALRKRDRGGHKDLVGVVRNGHFVLKVAKFIFDFNALLEEIWKITGDDHGVIDGLRAVDHKFKGWLFLVIFSLSISDHW